MRSFFKQFFSLCSPFWKNKTHWSAWLILAIVIGLGSAIAYINVRINEWSKTFYDALAALATDNIIQLLAEYAIYLAIFIVINVYRIWLRKLLIIRWRSAMTDYFLQRWLTKAVFYPSIHQQKMDNPDQRIAEDIRLFVEYSIELTVSFLFNLIQLWSFLMILWTISGAPQFTLFGETYVIKGYLVWVAAIYAIVGTLVTHLIGRKLHKLNYQQQQYEADFRASLIHKQNNAEQIAFYNGEQAEQAQLKATFSQIIKNWRLLMNQERNLGFFTVGYERFANLLPVIFSIPLLISKMITIGGLMQIRSAFSVVINAFSWFIFAYSILPKWTAAISRLSQLKQQIDFLNENGQSEKERSKYIIDTNNLAIYTPENQLLLSDINLQIKAKQWIYLKGESGIGKSTFLRTLNNIWHNYRGEYKQADYKTLFIPQKSYLNKGSLAEILSYPQAQLYPQQQLKTVLNLVGLSQWQAELDRQCDWENIFSGGEKQRLAFARILLSQPELIYLDEATSSLDSDAAAELMALLKQRLPDSSVIYISHQAELAQFADKTIELKIGER